MEKITDPSEVRWVYHANYYDGPLSGEVTWRGERYWIDTAGDDGPIVIREYSDPEDNKILWVLARILYTLTPEQWAEKDKRHQLFRECVGHHTDYVYVDGKRQRADKYKGTGREHEFYDAYPPGSNVFDPRKEAEPVAYFVETWIS